MKTKHHYVFRQYLRAWSNNDKITVTRLGKTFTTELMNIAQQRYFYRVSELTSTDVEFIKDFVINRSDSVLAELNSGWIDMFMKPQLIKQFLLSRGVHADKVDELMKPLFIEFEEDFHASIEGGAVSYINSLLKYELSIFNKKENFYDFVYFLSVQLFRTKKIKDGFIKLSPEYEQSMLERTWNVISHVFATNVSYELSFGGYSIIILKNKSSCKFITSDQPVINTFAYGRNMVNDNSVELYYPLSPEVSILLSKKVSEHTISEITSEQVEYYNELMKYFHYEIIFHSNKN
ncbi:DUF4238 domain-containing protein [Escherichia coli]|uniref:DUF4238 domain-containing protein n=1 Tax=Escherichia coli TaxID=562 RepID=UPI0012FFA72F|nr:DUF4238 domain-containing protein [Escherichia coli]